MSIPVLLEAASRALHLSREGLQHRDRRVRLGLVDASPPAWADTRCVYITSESLAAAVAGRAAFRQARRAAKEGTT